MPRSTKEFFLSKKNKELFKVAIGNDQVCIAKSILLNNGIIDLTKKEFNFFITTSVSLGRTDMVSLLLQKYCFLINESNNSYLLKMAYYQEKKVILNILWKNNIIRESLKVDNQYLHDKILKEITKKKVLIF